MFTVYELSVMLGQNSTGLQCSVHKTFTYRLLRSVLRELY